MEGVKTYQQKLNQLFAEAKVKRDISHLKDETGAAASWDSKVWVFTQEGQTLRFYFIRNTHPGVLTPAYIQAQPAFAEPICNLLMLYTLDVITKKIAIKTMYCRYQSARNFIVPMGMLSDLTPDASLTHCESLASHDVGRLKPFIDWVNDKLFGHAYLPIAKQTNPKQTGAEVLATRYDKLPDIKAVMALGAITHDTITGIEPAKWNTGTQDYQRDAYVCAMGALAMAAPNRIAAEQTVLSAQTLQRDRLNREGKERAIHWLDWIGSKGYANNQKHILKPMAECVEICLDYVLKATEPMRKLACFYVEPSLPLKRILTEEEADPQRWQKVSPDPDKPTNMVVLGYLLGFYPDTVTSVRVLKGTPGATQKQLYFTESCSHNERLCQLGTQAALPWYKPLWGVEASDTLVFSESSAAHFLGLKKRFKGCKKTGLYGTMSVQDAQEHWIEYVTQVLGGDLTRLRNNSKNGRCDLRTMLFAFNGLQLYGTVGKAGVTGGKSPFFPVGPNSLASLFSVELNEGGIFSRHGFNGTFHIRPHQFRHLLTTVGQEQGMVSEILNIWGGRRDPKQLLHYVHEDPKTRSSLIGDIMLADSPTLEEAKNQIRLVTQQEYENVVGVAASVTSTGICTQQLIYKPCDFFNDFENQCFLCKSSCHVAHDEDAISFLRRDLVTQQQRLDMVSKERKFATNSNMQSWFQIHTLQTALLQQLLDLMTSKNIEPGCIIRLLLNEGEVRITDLKTKKVRVDQFSLPGVKQILADKLGQSTSPSDDNDDFLDNLLGAI